MKRKRKNKKYAEPELGYCPLSIRQPGAGLGAQGSQVGTRDACSRLRQHGRAGRAGVGRAGGLAGLGCACGARRQARDARSRL